MSYCTGSIISPNEIVTAAHCVEKLAKEDYLCNYVEATMGHSNISSDQAISVGIKSVLVHPNYNESKNSSGNDIAILWLEDDLDFNTSIQPISLPSKNYSVAEFSEAKLIFAGYGIVENMTIEVEKRKEEYYSIRNIALKNLTLPFPDFEKEEVLEKLENYQTSIMNNTVHSANMKKFKALYL